MNGYLATITSLEESDFITANLLPPPAGENDVWVGGYQDVGAPDYSEPSGGWRWVTGEPWVYTNWIGGQPDNGSPSGNEDGLTLNSVYNGRWNDGTRPSLLPYYIVEYGITEPGEPGDPAEQIQEILVFVNSVAGVTLVGVGSDNSANNKLDNFIKQLGKVKDLIEDESFGEAFEKLEVLYKHSDGQDRPKDKVTGESVQELSEKIQALIESIEVMTAFLVPEDTWGPYDPDYCSGINAIDEFLCSSPITGKGICYAIATLELRWFRARENLFGLLPHLRTVYDNSPSWVQDYAIGILEHTSSLENIIASTIFEIENFLLDPENICESLKDELISGNPVLVLQRGKNSSGIWEGHAVVAYGFSVNSSEVNFYIADSNDPGNPQVLTFDKTSKTWSYYWNWSDFQTGIISLDYL